LKGVSPGDSVAIFGAGSIGLLAAYSARLRDAARIYVVDAIPARLQKAGELGAVPIDFLHGDPVEQIKESQSAWRRGSAFRQEKPLGGVSCAIDAIGFQARSQTDFSQEDPSWVIAAIAELLNPNGRVAITGVWTMKAPSAVKRSLQHGQLTVPWSKFDARAEGYIKVVLQPY